MINLYPYTILQWRCEETSGHYVFDSSGNNRTGWANYDTAQLTIAGKLVRGFSHKNISQETYVTKTNLVISITALSFGCWFRTAKARSDYEFFAGVSGDGDSLYIGMTVENKVCLSKNHFSNFIVTNNSYADNQWHYALATAENNYASLYVDNILIGTSFYRLLATLEEITLMASADMDHRNHFNGDVDCFNIFNKVLLPEERAFIWNNGYGTEKLANKGPIFILSSANTN